MKRTITDHRLQIEKPTCSEKIEKARLRTATRLPVLSQNAGSSGFHSWIHRPPARLLAVFVSVSVVTALIRCSPVLSALTAKLGARGFTGMTLCDGGGTVHSPGARPGCERRDTSLSPRVPWRPRGRRPAARPRPATPPGRRRRGARRE